MKAEGAGALGKLAPQALPLMPATHSLDWTLSFTLGKFHRCQTDKSHMDLLARLLPLLAARLFPKTLVRSAYSLSLPPSLPARWPMNRFRFHRSATSGLLCLSCYCAAPTRLSLKTDHSDSGEVAKDNTSTRISAAAVGRATVVYCILAVS